MADSEKKSAEPLQQPVGTSQSSSEQAPPMDEDSDPDFDDLDDVLDQFSANEPTTSQSKPSPAPQSSQTIPSSSGPGRPSSSTAAEEESMKKDEVVTPTGPRADESEADFMERLSREMSTMINAMASDPSKSGQSSEDMAKMGKELEEFTYKMEEQGIQPEDLLRALLGEEEGNKIANLAHAERDKREKGDTPSTSKSPQPPSSPPAAAPASTTVPGTSSSTSKTQPSAKSFEDTIRSTMSRLGESDKSATTAAQKSTQKSEEDLLADMLRALDAGPGGSSTGGGSGGNDEGLSKMFMDMMQQLTHKDLLYEPMKELDAQYPTWLAANKDKLNKAEHERYTRQSVIVADITRKFEEPGFSDDDPRCREFIWEKMQKMQDEGAPPEELVKNPFPGTDLGGMPGLDGGGNQMPEELAKELEDGCPTQ